MRLGRLTRPGLIVIGLLLLLACGAAAQLVDEVDPSVRGAGMGNLGVAAFREPLTAAWQNPALLGYQRGVGYAWSELDWGIGDLIAASHRLALGGAGLGLELAGWPIDALGGTGISSETRIVYRPDEILRYDEDLNTVALGGNVLEVASHVIPDRAGTLARAARLADLSAGAAVHQLRSSLFPGADQRVQLTDVGLALRLSPLGDAGATAFWPLPARSDTGLFGGLSLDLAFGYAWHNLGESSWESDARTYPMPSSRHYGGGLRLAVDPPSEWTDGLAARGLHWLAEALAPLVAITAGWERRERTSHEGPHGAFSAEAITRMARKEGWEIRLAGLLAVRGGEVDNPYGWPLGATSGWGISLPLWGYGRLDYDRATQEYGIDLELEQTLQGVTATVDAQCLWRRLQRGRP